ncbi:hypothetical protein SCAR479_02513 [Seiridium cardinale]|uniref:Uncharacterized protein n=1 Tax=Seiridium cardinale TaxID=138064 RepID=A0ABR2Y2U0_9PEZI
MASTQTKDQPSPYQTLLGEISTNVGDDANQVFEVLTSGQWWTLDELLEQPWFNTRCVECDNAPLFMRECSHWTIANLVGEEGFIGNQRQPPETVPKASWNLRRHFYLRGLQEPLRWVANPQAHSDAIEILRNIRLQRLSFTKVHTAHAWGVAGEAVY